MPGKGAWWNSTESGDVCFDDGENGLESVHKCPCLLHFRTSKLSDVVKCSKICWDKCKRDQLELPIEVNFLLPFHIQVQRVIFRLLLCSHPQQCPLQDLHTVKKDFKALTNLIEESLLIWPLTFQKLSLIVSLSLLFVRL